jgi:hypothetical protein
MHVRCMWTARSPVEEEVPRVSVAEIKKKTPLPFLHDVAKGTAKETKGAVDENE